MSDHARGSANDMTVLAGRYELSVGLYFVSEDDAAGFETAREFAQVIVGRLPNLAQTERHPHMERPGSSFPRLGDGPLPTPPRTLSGPPDPRIAAPQQDARDLSHCGHFAKTGASRPVSPSSAARPRGCNASTAASESDGPAERCIVTPASPVHISTWSGRT
jgi:hypothetical protein